MAYKQLTQAEVATIDRLQKKGTTPGEVLKTLRRSRRENGSVGPGKTAIYDFMNGTTHKRGAAERRGRKSRVPPGILTVANTERRKLIKKAKKGLVFTYFRSSAARISLVYLNYILTIS